MDDKKQKKMQLLAQILTVFTPAKPIDDLDLFAGRIDQVVAILTVVGQPGQHVILHGERGVGKTSLANIVTQLAATKKPSPPGKTARVNCNTEDNYQTLWRGILRKLGETCDEHTISANTVIETLEGMDDDHPLIIIDELDRFENNDGLSLLADTIKAVSDHALNTTFVLVGVGDTVTDIIGEHKSVQRALVQVMMPRMSTKELAEAVDRGLKRLRIKITDEAKHRITLLSEGLPSVTHRLAQHAAIAAVQDDQDTITAKHVDAATGKVVQKSMQTSLTAYELAIKSPRKENLFAKVLLACALAQKNDLGWFQPRSVKGPLVKILGRDLSISAFVRHLNEFAGDAHGRILQKAGEPWKFVYRFDDPMMQAYVIMRSIADGLLSDSLLSEYRKPEADEFEGA